MSSRPADGRVLRRHSVGSHGSIVVVVVLDVVEVVVLDVLVVLELDEVVVVVVDEVLVVVLVLDVVVLLVLDVVVVVVLDVLLTEVVVVGPLPGIMGRRSGGTGRADGRRTAARVRTG
jgi:hypothetical protein